VKLLERRIREVPPVNLEKELRRQLEEMRGELTLCAMPSWSRLGRSVTGGTGANWSGTEQLAVGKEYRSIIIQQRMVYGAVSDGPTMKLGIYDRTTPLTVA